MQATTISLCLFVVVALISSFKSCVSRRDTITFSSSLQDDGTTIVSARKSFELGFFNPEDKNNAERYVGIWYYNLRPRTVVWIANRNEPLLDGTGVFTIFKDGNLQLLNENGTSYFHTKLESSSYDKRTLQLLDSGNLALIDGRSGYYLWQSFEEPTDTFLPGMKMDENLKLVSWMDPGNPKIGNYTFQQNEDDNTVYMIMNRTILHWRSDATGSDELENRVTFMLSNFSRRDKPDTNISSKKRRDISYGAKINPSSFYYSDTRLLMNSSGEIQFYRKQQHGWSLTWSEPHDACAVNDPCGNFGICNLKNKVSACECLPGFAAVFPDSWKTGDFTGGCVRKSAICDKNSKPDIFLNLKFMKVGKPDLYYAGAESEDKWRYECLNNCKTKCQAYYYAEPNRILRRGTENAEANCLIWTSDLNNIQEYYDGGHNLSIRVAVAAIGSTSRDCKSCGKYIIPYPLSSGPSCGDPSYHSFSCNDSTGQLFFLTMNNSDEVIYINKEEQRFVIQINRRGAENCSARTSVETVLQLNQSMPFNVTNWCYNKSLTFSHEPSIQDGQRIEIGWKPPSEPICNSFNDCEDWPNSNCSASKRCLCYPNYRWDNLSLMCKSAVLSPSQTSTKPSVSMNHEAIIIVTTVIAVVLVAGSFSCFLYRRRILAKMEERKGSTPRNPVPPMDDSERKTNEIVVEDDKIVDVPYFSLESILAATDNFSDANKLGRGGFGPVYKGIFPGEKEIAIKRLSSQSVQGLVEFRNEVILIAKLQHRNLVRLLGYCIKGSEKKFFFTNQERCGLLDWNRRFDIILGIARGLLYLHQDSRLRIIHRDLKTSNILLDEEMNPKISDFGLARIVEGKETEANTMKIVGTYGYMSPEYAAEGLFSTKSDVFSFGVILFEIISGKRNTGFYQSKGALSLLGYAWKLWQERNVMGFVDKEILESCNGTEVMKCINIGLLCVEEDPSDRPTMSNVLTMLSSETTTLPSPNQPAFVARRRTISTSTSLTSKEETNSINEITISAEEGR